MSCINFKHPEVTKMAGELNIHPAVLAAKMGVWQNQNNIEDRFPTKEELYINNKEIKEFNLDDVLDTNEKSEIFTPIESKSNKTNDGNNYLEINKALLFNSEPRKILSASEVLKNIINNDILYKTKNGTFFLEKAFNLLNKSGAKFKVLTKVDFDNLLENSSKGTVMLYNSKTNEIYTTNEILSEMAPESIVEAFIHEVVHSITVKSYFDPKTFEEHEFRDFINKSYDEYKYLGLETDGEGNLMYGFENQAEFIAEIYSNPKFREKLKSLEENWWTKLIDVIRRIFTLPRSLENNNLINYLFLFFI